MSETGMPQSELEGETCPTGEGSEEAVKGCHENGDLLLSSMHHQSLWVRTDIYKGYISTSNLSFTLITRQLTTQQSLDSIT